jgi:hypothetical protein
MLLLYTRLFDYKPTPSEPEIAPNQYNLNESVADSEQESYAKFAAERMANSIRNIKQAYYLERRLFM